ncbi:MAG: FkbM family methyltransferase [Thermoguttaceae bacterium]|jgi:FkbM family methyltransferase
MNPLLLNKQIDLVNFGDVKLFMFRGDNLYNLAVPNDRKNCSLSDHYRAIQEEGYPASPLTPTNIDSTDDSRRCLHLVLGTLLLDQPSVTVLDIGAFVGDFAIRMGNLIRTFGKCAKVYAFDPTDAGALIPFNIAINGLEGTVFHENLAIASHSGYSLFTVVPGDYDAASAVKDRAARMNLLAQLRFLAGTRHKFAWIRKFARLFFPKPRFNILVRTTTIAEFAQRIDLQGSIFAKIDIEGMDEAVARDLRSLARERGKPAVIVFEFKPRSYEDHAAAIDFFKELAEEFWIFDIWYSPNPCFCTEIAPARIPEFVDTIANARPFAYTDVLLLPRSLPGGERLAQRLRSLKPCRLEISLT